MSAPRVLVVATVLGLRPSGVQRQASELLPRAAARLAARGGELVLLEGRVPLVLPGGAPLTRLASDTPPQPAHLRYLGERRALTRVLAQAHAEGRPFDLVHQGHQPFATGAVRAHGAVPVWLVHDLRRLEQGPAIRRRIAAGLFAHTARQSGAVLVVSQTVRDALLQRYPHLEGRVFVVPNAADHGLEHQNTLRSEASGPTEPYMLSVGHLEPRKSFETVFRALAQDADLPPFWLVGGHRGRAGIRELRKLQRLAAAPGCAGRVRFLGAVSDAELAKLYAGAALVLVPSQLEGFSIPALEALAAGAPLVASDIPVHREVAQNAAWYFPPGDAAACARACRAALASPGERSPAAIARAAHYSWDRSAEQLVTAWCAAAKMARL